MKIVQKGAENTSAITLSVNYLFKNSIFCSPSEDSVHMTRGYFCKVKEYVLGRETH